MKVKIKTILRNSNQEGLLERHTIQILSLFMSQQTIATDQKGPATCFWMTCGIRMVLHFLMVGEKPKEKCVSWHGEIIWNLNFSIHKWTYSHAFWIQWQSWVVMTEAIYLTLSIWPLTEGFLTQFISMILSEPSFVFCFCFFLKGLMIKSVWEKLSQFLNWGTFRAFSVLLLCKSCHTYWI